MMKINKFKLDLLIIFALILTGCESGWEIQVKGADQSLEIIDNDSVSFYLDKSQEEIDEVQLGQMFYDIGYTLIDEISITSCDDVINTYNWDSIAETTTISKSGKIVFEDGTTLISESISVEPSSQVASIEYSILDIAPTIATAIGLPNLEETAGKVIFESTVEHAVMILLDGTQYQKLHELADMERLSFFTEKTSFQPGLTIYPPITTSASAALLTSLPPQENGVYGYGYRSTENTTLFDLAAQEGKTVIAVEGNSLPFNLRNAETILSGDRDENGFSDDNVFTNSIDVIQSRMPDLLYIHFHEIDDMGHTYGPESDEYASAIQRVNQYLEDIYDALPENTLIVIFADHGMHSTKDGGNHGTLTASDLIIPIIFLEK